MTTSPRRIQVQALATVFSLTTKVIGRFLADECRYGIWRACNQLRNIATRNYIDDLSKMSSISLAWTTQSPMHIQTPDILTQDLGRDIHTLITKSVFTKTFFPDNPTKVVGQMQRFLNQHLYLDPEFIKTFGEYAFHHPNITDRNPDIEYDDCLFPYTPNSLMTSAMRKHIDLFSAATWKEIQYLPTILVGVAKNKLAGLSPAAARKELSFLGDIDIVFNAINDELPDISAENHRFDNLHVLHRNNLDDHEFIVFPAIPTLDVGRQFGDSVSDMMPRRAFQVGKFLIPVATFEHCIANNARVRLLSASCRVENLTAKTFRSNFRQMLNDYPDTATDAIRQHFGLKEAEVLHIDMSKLGDNYINLVANRLNDLNDFIDLPNFTVTYNVLAVMFRRKVSKKDSRDAGISYKLCKIDRVFPKYLKHYLLALRSTINMAPNVVLSDDISESIEYIRHYVNRTEKFLMNEKELLEAVKRENTKAEADTGLNDILSELQNDPVYQAVRAEAEKDKRVNDALASLGLSELSADGTPKSPHVKIKEIKTDYIKELNKTNKTFLKYQEILKRKARPYRADQPLSNSNPYYIELTTPGQAQAMFNEIIMQGVVGYDVETTGLHPLKGNRILTHQFSTRACCGAMIRQEMFEEYPEVFAQYKTIMESPSIVKVIHNLKFEYTFTSTCLKTDIVNYFDTMIAAHMLNENTPNGLKYLAQHELGVDMIEFDEVTYGTKQYDVNAVYAVEYACADADMALQLYYIFKPQIDKGGTDDELQKSGGAKYTTLFYDISLPIAKLLGKMELAGIVMNQGLLHQMKKQVDRDYKKLWDEIQLAKPGLNPDSAKQLATYLYTELGLPVIQYTKGSQGAGAYGTGQPSTDKKVMKRLAAMYPEQKILGTLIEYSELAQFKTLYIESLPKHFNPNTCAIHTQINQTRTVTSRFSSSDPNLQNLRKNRKE
jgi:hypothetical protein